MSSSSWYIPLFLCPGLDIVHKCIHDDMCVLVLILSTCHTTVVLQGIIHVCNFFFNHNVYTMIPHVFSSWVCDLLDIMKINLSNLSNLSSICLRDGYVIGKSLGGVSSDAIYNSH